jgi:hypothetical protein
MPKHLQRVLPALVACLALGFIGTGSLALAGTTATPDGMADAATASATTASRRGMSSGS